MKIPKNAQCDNHENKVAVAKLQYSQGGVKREERVCLDCGDLWWGVNGKNEEILATLEIKELTQGDLIEENKGNAE